MIRLRYFPTQDYLFLLDKTITFIIMLKMKIVCIFTSNQENMAAFVLNVGKHETSRYLQKNAPGYSYPL